MDDTVIIAFTALAGIVVSSTLGPWLSARSTRKALERKDERDDAARKLAEEKAAEIARVAEEKADKVAASLLQNQTKVAAKVEIVATQTAEAATLLVENNKKVAETAEQTALQLKAIHSLVNSDMTSALTSELNQARISLATLKRIVALAAAAGQQLDPDDDKEITRTIARIRLLTENLDAREAQQRAAPPADRGPQQAVT